MDILAIAFSIILITGGCFVIYLAFFSKGSKGSKGATKMKTIRPPKSENPTEEDLVNAILDSIQNGDWERQDFGGGHVMRNKITNKKIFLDGQIAGMFAFDTYDWEDTRNRKKIVDAYNEYAGLTKTGWNAIEAITGYKRPDDEVDPVVLEEAKKNLKKWTK